MTVQPGIYLCSLISTAGNMSVCCHGAQCASAHSDSTPQTFAAEHDCLSQRKQRVNLHASTGSEYKLVPTISDEWKEAERQVLQDREAVAREMTQNTVSQHQDDKESTGKCSDLPSNPSNTYHTYMCLCMHNASRHADKV